MRFRILAPAFAILLISACASVNTTSTIAPGNAAAEQLLRDGKYRDAALAYEADAAAARPNQRDASLIRAANAWAKAGDISKAKQLLSQCQRRKLNGDSAFLYDLLSAEFLIADKKGTDAVSLLGQVPESVPELELRRWHSDRSLAFAAAGMYFSEAGEQVWLMQAMKPKERAATGRNVERLMGQITAPELAQKSAALAANDPLYAYAARELKKRGMPLPKAVASSTSSQRADAFPPAESDGYRPPTQLAVLLPLSGNSAGAGLAVRDGFLTQYYDEKRRRPRIQFYDTAGSAEGARAAVSKALSDGAQMIVGPLTREEVNAVTAISELNVPVLFLNRAQDAPAIGNISYALSPDEEGWISADRLANRGLMTTTIFTQRDDTAQRSVSAFKDQYKLRGGHIVAELLVEGEATDLPTKILAMLSASDTNASSVYLALKAPQARAVMLQIKTSSLANVPKLASSVILNGASTSLDTVLNGVELPELPWLLNQYNALPEADVVSRTMPNIRGSAQRLFAFGADAWQICAYFDRLQKDPGFVLSGATGSLRIDSLGNVQRDPAWAVFGEGRPRMAPR